MDQISVFDPTAVKDRTTPCFDDICYEPTGPLAEVIEETRRKIREAFSAPVKAKVRLKKSENPLHGKN